MQVRGYVAFVDLLGFSARMRGETGQAFFESYRAALDNALATVPVRYVVSSDSIVLYHPKDDEQGLVEIVIACARLFHTLSCAHVPCRGAVSYGSFFVEQTTAGTIIAGTPILEAYSYEQRQNRVGIMLTPSIMARNPHISTTQKLRQDVSSDTTGTRLISLSNIPFHNAERTYEGFSIIPTADQGAELIDYVQGLERVRAALNYMHALAPDPQSQQKYVDAITLTIVAENNARNRERAQS